MPGDMTLRAGQAATNLKSASGTNGTLLYRGKCILRGWAIFCHSTTPRYFKFYDMATVPNVGVDVPVFKLAVPASATSDLGFANLEHSFVHGVPFYVGLAYAITTGIADNDTGACSVDDINGTFDWSPTR